MRWNSKESLEQWADRVRIFEYGYALQQIAHGHPIELVMEAMSVRIQQKIMHPILKVIKDSHVSTYDAVASRENYKQNYLDQHGPVADHVYDDN
jgi:hypothetical protein